MRTRESAAFLKALPGGERLEVFDGCDLLAPRSFDAAVAGCDAVMHTASPFALNVKGCGARARAQAAARTAACFLHGVQS